MTSRATPASGRLVSSLVAGCLALAVGGCTSQPHSSSESAEPARASPPSAPPSSSAASTPPADDEGEPDRDDGPTHRPTPPPSYEPSWPDRTVRTEAGFPVNNCVPEELHDGVISLTAKDGIRLSALVLGEGENGVLLGHEQGYNICSFLNLGVRLADHGFTVMLPEYRDHGASELSAEQTVERVYLDADAALEELQRRGAETVFVGGASCGGTTTATAGAKLADPVGLLIMSSPAQCGRADAIPAVGRIETPSLFIVAPGDMNGAVEAEVRKLYEASASPDKELEIIDSGGHGTQLFTEPGTGQRLEDDVFDFIVDTFP